MFESFALFAAAFALAIEDCGLSTPTMAFQFMRGLIQLSADFCCPVSGRLLDVNRAVHVLVDASWVDDLVVDADVALQVVLERITLASAGGCPTHRWATVRVVDGRLFTADGLLRSMPAAPRTRKNGSASRSRRAYEARRVREQMAEAQVLAQVVIDYNRQATEHNRYLDQQLVLPFATPAAACPRCGGWTGCGGMSQYSTSTVSVHGRRGCGCHRREA